MDWKLPPMPIAWGWIDGCRLIKPSDEGCPVHLPK
jgi:hypothetical protein